MNRACALVFLIVLASTPGLARAQQPLPVPNPPAPPASLLDTTARSPLLTAAMLEDPFPKVNELLRAESSREDGKRASARPGHIRDNGFLVEEAYNQEKGVVQHVFNWINTWDRDSQGRSRGFLFSYTMELPLGGQTHQFSFTPQFLTQYERPQGGTATQTGDITDTVLSYRYQLMADDDLLWMAPRASLILPTGDERFGFGIGRVGYQFNLPISRYDEWFDVHFNAGITYAPKFAAFLEDGTRSQRLDLRVYNLGGSVYWKPRRDLHFFVEALALRIYDINDEGNRGSSTQLFVNPGVRFAIIQDPVEWVLGVSVPVGLTKETPDIGVFAYMSIEHAFRKLKKGGGE